MIHYTCDLCHRNLNDRDDQRYVVRIEVFPAVDGEPLETEDDRDYLSELHDSLEQLDLTEFGESADDDSQELRFDLCPDCRRRFTKNPLGRDFAEFGFSQN